MDNWQRLWQLRTGTLKVDRSLVTALPHDGHASAMVAAALGLAGALGMTPAATGIETDDQLDFLVQHGCVLGQGHLISAPLTGAQVSQYCAPSAPAASHLAIR